MGKLPDQLQSLVNNIEATNVVVAGQLNISTDFRDLLVWERKEISHRLQHGICTHSDVLKGLCSFDAGVRALAAYRAGEDKILSAVPLLLGNLLTPDNDVLLLTVQALGQLRSTESVKSLMEIAENYSLDEPIRGTARQALANIGEDAISEDTFVKWMSWLSSDEHRIWFTAYNNLRGLQQQGMLDTQSVESILFQVADTGNDEKRELLYWLLSEIPHISNRMLEFEKKFSTVHPYRTLFPILWSSCVDGVYQPVAEHMEEILDSADDVYRSVDAQNAAALCIVSGDERCKSAAERYLELNGESQRQSILSKFKLCRATVDPKAFGFGKQAKSAALLIANERFNETIKMLFQGGQRIDDKTDMMLVITQSMSSIAVKHVGDYLNSNFGFIVFDCRFASTGDVRSVAAGLSLHKNIALLLNRQLHPSLTMMLNWIYEESVVRISASNSAEGHKLGKDSHLIGIMEEEDYSNLDLGNGWSRHKLVRMLSPIVHV